MQHLSKKTQFWGFLFPQVVQKHILGEVGKWSTFWLPTLSVTSVPKIIVIKLCTSSQRWDVFWRHGVYESLLLSGRASGQSCTTDPEVVPPCSQPWHCLCLLSIKCVVCLPALAKQVSHCHYIKWKCQWQNHSVPSDTTVADKCWCSELVNNGILCPLWICLCPLFASIHFWVVICCWSDVDYLHLFVTQHCIQLIS